VALHQHASHRHRVAVLIGALAAHVPEGASLLDLGCGDLSIADGLRRARNLKRCVGADVWPARFPPPAGCEYHEVPADAPLPFDSASFDTVTLVDTLHHAQDPASVLAEASRVGRRVIVKDHFEYGAISRLLLKALDWAGNAAYKVPIPGRYFTDETFRSMVKEAAPGAECSIEVGVDLYGHYPLGRWILPPSLHFIAVLQRPW